ncbi:hypothetical protein Esti_006582 [Eimeria stiedai]
MLDSKKSDYLTRVTDLAAEAENRFPPPPSCEDSRRPKSLSRPALPGWQPHAEGTPSNSPRHTKSPSTPSCGFCGKKGHTYTVCNRSKAFCATRKWAIKAWPNEQRPQEQRPDTPSRSKSEPVSAVHLSQNGKSEIIHPGGSTPEGGSAQMPDDSEARDTQTQRGVIGRGHHYCLEFTLADSEAYHELGRKREAAQRDGGSWSLTEERAYRASAENSAIHFGVDLPRWVEFNDWVPHDVEQPRCASMSVHSKSGGNVYV